MATDYNRLVERDNGVTFTLEFVAPDVGQDRGHERFKTNGRGRPEPGFRLRISTYERCGVEHSTKALTWLDAKRFAILVDDLTGESGVLRYVEGIESAMPGAVRRALAAARSTVQRLREQVAAFSGEVPAAEPDDDDISF